MSSDEEEFSAFVCSRSRELQRLAWLLTGDWSTAEDLVQTSLIKTWRRWSSVQRRDVPEVYVRRVMMTTFIGWRRRNWIGEITLGWLPERVAFEDMALNVARREAVVAAVRRLPKRQRAVIVLRYFEDLSEQATADALGCRVGTVKSHHSRAMATLRSNAALQAVLVEGDE